MLHGLLNKPILKSFYQYLIGDFNMKTTVQNFHSMRGNVADGCIIVAPSGKEFILKNTIKGWLIYHDNLPISGVLPGANDVDYFVYNALCFH
jgi:hypothetical protein